MEGQSLSSCVRKGAWTAEEDALLKKCIENFGEGKWHQVPSRAGLNRCRKSCRLRWLNYLKPDIKRGYFAADEIDLIIRLHNLLGNRWSLIAGRLPGRTANDVKNYWNTHLLKNNKTNRVSFVKHLNPKSSYQSPSKLNTKLVKPRPQTLLKNTIFPISPVAIKININNNNNTGAIQESNDSILADHNRDNISYCFPNGNDEMMWLENLLMNDEDQQADSVNKIGTHCNLDDIFLDVEQWSVFDQ